MEYGVLLCTVDVKPATFHSFLELSAQQVTLEEADNIIGRSVPIPTHLPVNYEIREIYAYGSEIIILISDGGIEKELVNHTDAAGSRQRYEFQCRMRIGISWTEDEAYIPPIKIGGIPVGINGLWGKIIPSTDANALWFCFQPDPSTTSIFDLQYQLIK